MYYDLADIGAIVDKHNRNVPGYRIGDRQLFDALIDALHVKGGTVYGLLADARAILAADLARSIKTAEKQTADRSDSLHPIERDS